MYVVWVFGAGAGALLIAFPAVFLLAALFADAAFTDAAFAGASFTAASFIRVTFTGALGVASFCTGAFCTEELASLRLTDSNPGICGVRLFPLDVTELVGEDWLCSVFPNTLSPLAIFYQVAPMLVSAFALAVDPALPAVFLLDGFICRRCIYRCCICRSILYRSIFYTSDFYGSLRCSLFLYRGFLYRRIGLPAFNRL